MPIGASPSSTSGRSSTIKGSHSALKRVSDGTKVWHQEARRRYELDWKTLLTEHFVGRCSDSRDEDLMEAEGSQATSAAAARVAPTLAVKRWSGDGWQRVMVDLALGSVRRAHRHLSAAHVVLAGGNVHRDL